jgi:hypothetical protein
MGSNAAKWLTPEKLTLLRGMACVGKDECEIAACMGISQSTLTRWKKQYPEIASALAYGKDGADYAVMEALHRKAVGYTTPVKKTYKLKRTEFDPESGKKLLEYEELQTGIDEAHVPADTRAEIFWLQNRCAGEWGQDKQEIDAESGGVTALPPVMDAPEPPDDA